MRDRTDGLRVFAPACIQPVKRTRAVRHYRCMSSTTKGILFGLVIAIAVAARAQDPVELQQLVRKSPFIFYGTVRKTGAANVDAVPASPSNAIVRLDRVLAAPPSLGNFTGRDITVALLKAESPKNGERAVFFTTGWIYGRTLAVREVSHLAGIDDVESIGARVNEAQRLNREEDLAALLARAEIVVRGTVILIEPVDREKTRLPLTEHD